MNDFEKMYKDTVEQIPSFAISAESVLNEARHRKAVAARRRQKCAAFIVIFCVLAMGTVGTATAMNYRESIIRVNEYGFTTADAKTTKENEMENLKIVRSVEEEFQPETEYIADMNVEEIPQYEYASIEEFYENSDVTAAFPNLKLFRTQAEQQIIVCGNILHAWFETGEQQIVMSQMDFSNCEVHASSVQYADKVFNERTFTTSMGFRYTLVDSKNSEDNTVSTHAAISVGGREVILDFNGFSAEEVEKILEDFDLTVYFQ